MSFTWSRDALLSTLDALGASKGGGGVEVDFDWTVVGQVTLFLILFVALKPILFDPMLKLFEERERRIEGARKSARDIDTTSAGALAKYDEAMAKARTEGNTERDRIRGQGLAKEAELLAKVRAATSKQTDEGRRKAQEELAEVRESLRAEMPGMARQLASRVLGREVA
jgi:F-type H+-transporting ATPase subunit b